MEFAHPALLGWAALAGIPVLIHLLARPRPQRIPFAAVRFLKATQEKSRNVLRLKHLLLLLLRVLVLVAFVLAVARPVAHGVAALADAPVVGAGAAVLVDDTFGLRYGDRYAATREAAARALDALPPGAPAAVFFASGERTAFLLDHEGLRQEVLRAPCSARWADLTGVLRRILAESARRDVSAVTVVTDLAANKWPPLPADASPPDRKPPTLTVIDVGDADTANASVRAVTLDPEEPRAGQRVRVRAVAAGGTRGGQRTVELWIGGEKRDAKAVALAPDGEAEAVLEFTAPAPGAYGGTVRLTPPDGLDLDDARSFAVNVPDPVPVLLVGAAEDEREDAFYLATALAPPGLASRQRFRVARAGRDDLATRPLSLYRAVVVASAGRLEAPQWKVLGDYVEAGGGVALFTGTGSKAEDFNSVEAARLLPVLPGERIEAPGKAWRMEIVEARHPVLAPFEGGRAGDLAGAGFRAVIGSSPARGAGSTAVLARFPGELAALAERRLGAGRVLWFGGPLAPAASDFARRPAFPLFVHALVAYLAGEARVPRDVPPGEVLRGVAEVQAGEARVEWVGPPGTSPVIVRVDPRNRVFALADTEIPGVYEARYAVGGQTRRTAFAVNVDPRGSDLRRLAPEELRARLPGLDVRVEPAGRLASAFGGAGGGGADWLPAALLAFVVVLLAGESWLAART